MLTTLSNPFCVEAIRITDIESDDYDTWSLSIYSGRTLIEADDGFSTESDAIRVGLRRVQEYTS